MITITKQEAIEILGWTKSIIQCEEDSVTDFGPDYQKKADVWKGLHKKLKREVRAAAHTFGPDIDADSQVGLEYTLAKTGARK